MNAQEMWDLYSKKEHIHADYDAWAFGGEPDALAQLVLRGIKTGTSSAFPLYKLEGESIPREGEYSVILDSRNEAVCVIKTTKVYVVPFRNVGSDHARREGEGDRSLSYWRRIHEEFFAEELSHAGLVFTEDMNVVCEEFCVVYP